MDLYQKQKITKNDLEITLMKASKETDLEVNAEETKRVVLLRD
jgi:hypothetical protein